jgi:hypothetical protein
VTFNAIALTRYISIRTQPPEATVNINGLDVGKTPLEIYKIVLKPPQDSIRIRCSMENYQD